MAIIYGGLNDKGQAFAWLDKVFMHVPEILPSLRVDVVIDNLRDDPRFKAMLKRMTLNKTYALEPISFWAASCLVKSTKPPKNIQKQSH